MDIEQYLKIEFETYPQAFRHVVRFLAKEDVRQGVMSIPKKITCPCCFNQAEFKTEEHAHGRRYTLMCTGCNRVSGEPQRSPVLAWLQWQSKKGATLTPIPPLLDMEGFSNMLKVWMSEADDANWARWIGSLNWVKSIWSKHKQTKDYELLGESDQVYVDAIGFSIEVLRRHAVEFAKTQSFDVFNESTKPVLKKEFDRIIEERAKYYPRYQSRLTPVFRFKVKKLLGM